jgi:hypothetical protein
MVTQLHPAPYLEETNPELTVGQSQHNKIFASLEECNSGLYKLMERKSHLDWVVKESRLEKRDSVFMTLAQPSTLGIGYQWTCERIELHMDVLDTIDAIGTE